MKQKHASSIKEENNQILLCNSHRPAKDFLVGLKLRNNGKHNRIPNYFIEKDGKVHKLNKSDITPEYLSGYCDSGVTVIALENLGWLKRRSNDGKFIDWLGNIYINKAHQKKWRGKLFWDEYTEKQTESTSEVIKNVCEEKNIPNEFIGHNVFSRGC